ncbi:hypothetical protein EBR03_10060 [bacterium]|nr:hypothetical protein [bacterium]
MTKLTVDWQNIERCAQQRADEKTFNWDEDSNPLGDLETRELARMMAYRSALISAILNDIFQPI